MKKEGGREDRKRVERWKGRGRRGEESVRWDSHFLRQFWKSYFVFKRRFVWKFILIDIYLFCIILGIIGIRMVRWNKFSKVSLDNENVHGFDRIFERRGRHGLVMTLPSKSRSFRELQMVTRCSRFWNKQRTDPRRRWMIKWDIRAPLNQWIPKKKKSTRLFFVENYLAKVLICFCTD